MKRGLAKLPVISTPNEWLGDEKHGVWEYGNYRHCYLTIRRLDNGKYRPNLGSDGNVPLADKPLPVEGYFQYDTFEQAAKHLFDYVDWLRDEWDENAKVALYAKLHKLNPNVFFS